MLIVFLGSRRGGGWGLSRAAAQRAFPHACAASKSGAEPLLRVLLAPSVSKSTLASK